VIGNTVFVHGGLDPAADPAMHLAAPYSQFGGNHWPGSRTISRLARRL